MNDIPGRSCIVCLGGDSEFWNKDLCHHCAAWNDLFHITQCLYEQYSLVKPRALTLGPSESPDTNCWPGFEFQPLDDLSSFKNCPLCFQIEEATRSLHGMTPDLEVAVGRPFPLPSPRDVRNLKASTQDEVEQDVAMCARYLLHIFVRLGTASDADLPNQNTFELELEMHYSRPGYGLVGINRWDRTGLDLNVVQQWLSDCQEHHGSRCNQPFLTRALPHTFRLIDTDKWCITSAPDGVEYLALSYVWAETPDKEAGKLFQLELGNITALERQESLKSDQIPEVIIDAIHLSGDLGYRYLWVDRLCIVQDGGPIKQEQINAMDAIYHQAFMTIVSLGEGPTMGLPGASSRPRSASLKYTRWQSMADGKSVGALPRQIHHVVSESRWNTRGWTYQERVLSRRHLFIGENHAYLNCFHGAHDCDSQYRNHYRESRGKQKDDFSGGHGFERGILKPTSYWLGTPFTVYRFAVADYTVRELTFDIDTLNAFSGVANAFAARHKTRPIHGLPEQDFLQALLWRHLGSRRLRVLPDQLTLPSWSWAAWKGTVIYDTMIWEFGGYPYSVSPDLEAHLGSLVTFHYADPAEGLRRIHDRPLWFGRGGLSTHATEEQLSHGYAFAISSRMINMPLDGDTHVRMWKDCIHNPWVMGNHAELKEDAGSIAELYPKSLIFNTTIAHVGIRQAIPISPIGYARNNSTSTQIRFDLIANDGTVVGQMLSICEEEGQEMCRLGRTYLAGVLGASVSNYKETQRVVGNEPWGLLVIVMDRQRGISRRLALGAVNPQAWTKIGAQWETVVLV